MPLAFLAPAFLLGLAALAVPVLLHLVQRERKRVVPFPSLMFLERLPYRSVRRRRLRHLALLLLRCLALVLLAAAFARPLLLRSAAAPRLAGGAREVVLLLDRSYSMGYAGRWAAARAAASRVLSGLAPGDHVSLVVFDAGAALAVPPTTDAAPVRAVLDTLRVGWQRTRYAPALKLAADILGASRLERREAVLISDFQKIGRDAADPVRLPPGARLTPLQVGAGPAPNVSVTGVTFRREPVPGAERVTATARLTNAGAAPVRDLAVTLQLDGRDVETRRVTLAPSAATVVTFAPVILAHPDTRGSVRVAPDALPADDAYRFVLAPGQALPVLVLDGGSGGRSLYLERALSFSEPPGFRVSRQELARFRAADLEGAAVVVLDDAPFPGGEAGRRLRDWVARGGGLLVLLGDASRPDGIPGIPASAIGPSTDAGGPDGLALGRLEYGHPILEPFAAPGAGTFADARFYRRRPIAPGDSGAVLARFEDGVAALVERRYARGRVLLWGSSFDAGWSDFPLKPVFLPFVQQLVRYASAWTPAPVAATVGQVIDPTVARQPIDARTDGAPNGSGARAAGGADLPAGRGDLTVIAPSGARTRLSPGAGAPALALGEAGFYELRDGDARPARVIAANPDLAESDLSALDPQELAAAVTTPAATARPALEPDLTPAERDARQRVWWYLLAGAFALFATETFVSNRLSRGGGVEA